MAATVPQERTTDGRVPSVWTLVALAIALLGTAGSLALSLALGLKACPLCFYQRSFMMGTLAVLAVGLAADRSQSQLYGLLAFPLSVAGLGVAVFHEYLVVAGVLECPLGLFGIGTAPAQSLALFVILAIALLGAALTGGRAGGRSVAVCFGAGVLGLLLGWASIISSPPLPAAPSEPYDPVEQPLEMCRPAYRPAGR